MFLRNEVPEMAPTSTTLTSAFQVPSITPEVGKMSTANVFKAQVVCVYFKPNLTISSSGFFTQQWTPQPEFNLVPSPYRCVLSRVHALGSSFLSQSFILSLIWTKSSILCEVTHLPRPQSISRVTTLQVADIWINNIAFARSK